MAFIALLGAHFTMTGIIANSCSSKVGVPYIRAKAQDFYEELGGGINSDLLEEGTGDRQLRALTDPVSEL